MGILKRLGIGLLKGLLVGAAVGTGFQVGLGWGDTPGLLGYLLAMGTGATAGILAGTPPWKVDAWIEALLKGLFGVGVGAGLYWLSSSFLSFQVPFALPAAEPNVEWTRLPLIYAPIVGAFYGAFVELDNTGSDPKGAAPKKKDESGAAPIIPDIDEL